MKTGGVIFIALLALLFARADVWAAATGGALGASWWQIVAAFLNENAGVTFAATAVVYGLFRVVIYVWYAGRASTKWDAMDSNVKTLQTDVGALQADVGALKNAVSALKADIRAVQENITKIVQKLIPEEQVLILRGSPLHVTSTGKEVAEKIGAGKLLSKYCDYLKKTVNATNPHNAYDIEIASMDVARGMGVVLSGEEKDIIKGEAFTRGIPYEEILSIIGVMLRDKLLAERDAPPQE